MKRICRFGLAIWIVTLGSGLQGAEYFVSKSGNDANDGKSSQTAFANIQKGVDVLEAGDTLTIAPGEYFGSVKRNKLGSPDKSTTIRAEIPGTVLMRGDVPIKDAFQKVEGSRFVYATDWEGELPQAINELDTLRILENMPTISAVDAMPGSFHYNASEKKLYLSTTDQKSPATHRYSASVTNADGLYLGDPNRVILDGLVVSGFNSTESNPWNPDYRIRHVGLWVAWGILVGRGKNCEIRNCVAYLNGGGIGVDNSEGEMRGGGNVVEGCVVYGNYSQLNHYESAGIGIYRPNKDEIRNCLAYNNKLMGIKTYAALYAPAKITNTIAWGNRMGGIAVDFHIKDANPDKENEMTRVENSVAMRFIKIVNLANSIVPKNDHHFSKDNIFLISESGEAVDLNAEFADPENHDFRLQADSSFRGKGPEGKDSGPNPYKANIFYAKPNGNDTDDGLSVNTAWKTLARATKNLRGGDTLYLEAGHYRADLDLHPVGGKAGAISIRGRGLQPTVIEGKLKISGGASMKFERLNFVGEVRISKGREMGFNNCRFAASATVLEAANVKGLRITHCEFSGFQEAAVSLKDCTKVYLAGNIFDNSRGVALRSSDGEGVQYSDYNNYSKWATAWETGGKPQDFSELQKTQDQQSWEMIPQWVITDKIAILENASIFSGVGPAGKPIGTYQDVTHADELKMIADPEVHSVSATTANIEWMTSLQSTSEITWGDTPECTESDSIEVNRVGTYSLTGLKPATTYYFKVQSIGIPKQMAECTGIVVVPYEGKTITFTTQKENAPPQNYYVASDGNDNNTGKSRNEAWRTITYAAGKVNVGDSVVIAGGTYVESIRMRATGEKDSPITFKAATGEKVLINGANKNLLNAFSASRKSHLNFDGFYFTDYGQNPDQGWYPGFAGTFLLSQCADIRITRCFDDGRNGYTAVFVSAYEVENLFLKNCVQTNKFCGMNFWRCPNLRIENCVSACPMIFTFILRNEAHQQAIMNNNIFIDMFEKKAVFNLPFFAIDESIEGLRQDNNCYFVRAFPPEERALAGSAISMPIGQLGKYITNALFADPAFAGAVAITEKGGKSSKFPPDALMDPALSLDFPDFFATNPEVVKRGIGLIPEDFADSHFNKKP